MNYSVIMVSRTFLPNIGGIESLSYDIASSLTNRKHKIQVITAKNKGSLQTEELNGIRITRCNTITLPYRNAYFSPSLLWRLPKDGDIVHFISCLPTFYNLYGLLHYRIRKLPMIYTTIWPPNLTPRLHRGLKRQLGIFYNQKLLKIFLNQCAAIVCLTEGEAKSYSELLGSDKYITSIPECVNVPESMPDSNLLKYVKNRFRILEKEHVLLSVGRIHPTKRLELCINAFKLVSENFGNVKLIVVGPQDNEDYIVKLKRDVRKLNLEKKVIFTGKVSMEERDCLYSLASLVMHTSEYEAFCRPALEAWRYKTPIVAFNLGPATDFIEKDRGGYVTKRWGDIVEMSQLVTKVLGRREFTALGNNGYDAVIKKYSKERIAEQYSKVYEKVLETRMSP